MLDLVVLNVGISQQLFDVRLLSDHLHQMYQPDTRRSTPRLWIVEVLLVMAVGRLLQAKSVPNEDLPGASLFREASRLLPGLSVLNKHGVLGIEVVALTALYLQIADQKEEAYVQVCRVSRILPFIVPPTNACVKGKPCITLGYCSEYAQSRE